MAWNEPGNKDNDPWGNKNRNDKGPPNLDEVFKKLFARKGGNNSSGNNSNPNPTLSFGAIGIVLIIGILVWFFSGLYTIKEAERGVVLRFGSYAGEVGPGLHWKATFIDNVLPVDVSTRRSLRASGSMLTADENLVDVELDVQYQVDKAYEYLFSTVDANTSLREATDSALRYVIGHSKMDDILTTGRAKVRDDTLAEIERIIEGYNLGLMIVDVNFLPARPPEEVKDAFDDAISAQEDEQRFIRLAEAYEREIEPKARGQVQRISQEARAYKDRVLQDAKGAVARFNKLLPEYAAAPEVTRKRLYLDAMQQVFTDTNKVLIDSESSGNLMYLPLDKLMNNKSTPTASPVTTSSVNTPSINSEPSTLYSVDDIRPSRESRMRQGRG